MIKHRCRLCHSAKTSKLFDSLNYHGSHLLSIDKFTWYQCLNCQAYFLPKLEKDSHYYSKYYPPDYYPNPTLLTKITNFMSFSYRKILINHYLSAQKSISILDVGCGTGLFLDSLPSNFNKFGVELNQQACQSASLKNITIYNLDINKIKFNRQFDCITLWHVLEHLPNPSLTLKKIHQHLKPGGILIMTTPNTNCLGMKYGQNTYFHLDSPRHLFIPSPASLSRLINKSGLSSPKYHYPFFEFPLDLFWSVRQSIIRFLIYPFYPLFKLFSHETILTVAFNNK